MWKCSFCNFDISSRCRIFAVEYIMATHMIRVLVFDSGGNYHMSYGTSTCCDIHQASTFNVNVCYDCKSDNSAAYT